MRKDSYKEGVEEGQEEEISKVMTQKETCSEFPKNTENANPMISIKHHV
jgi:hypothetical protein